MTKQSWNYFIWIYAPESAKNCHATHAYFSIWCTQFSFMLICGCMWPRLMSVILRKRTFCETWITCLMISFNYITSYFESFTIDGSFVPAEVTKWIYGLIYNSNGWNHAGVLLINFVPKMNCIIIVNLSQKVIKPSVICAGLFITEPISISNKLPLLLAYHRLVPIKCLLNHREAPWIFCMHNFVALSMIKLFMFAGS